MVMRRHKPRRLDILCALLDHWRLSKPMGMQTVPPTQPEEPSEVAATLLPDGTVVIAQAVLPVWGRQLDAIHEQLHEGVTELTQALVAIHELHDQLARTPLDDAAALRERHAQLVPALQSQIELAVSGLQVGDRLSQMLTVVRGDMQRLIDHMPLLGSAGLQHAEHWLEELRSRYTTPEQHRVHDGNIPAEDSGGIDYF